MSYNSFAAGLSQLNWLLSWKRSDQILSQG